MCHSSEVKHIRSQLSYGIDIMIGYGYMIVSNVLCYAVARNSVFVKTYEASSRFLVRVLDQVSSDTKLIQEGDRFSSKLILPNGRKHIRLLSAS